MKKGLIFMGAFINTSALSSIIHEWSKPLFIYAVQTFQPPRCRGKSVRDGLLPGILLMQMLGLGHNGQGGAQDEQTLDSC